MAQMRVYRFELLSATTGGAGQMRVYRFELENATTAGGNRMRVYRFELLNSGTTGTAAMRVYRFELKGSRGGFSSYDDTTQTWVDEGGPMWEYDLPTTTWRQVF